MRSLTFAKQLYDLDTLDTRFTSASNVPYQTVIDARSDPAASEESAAKIRNQSQPSKWRTPEFQFYLAAVAVIIPSMLYVAYTASLASDPRYPRFERYLADGWIPGRKIDMSDAQYSTFRGNLPYIGLLLIFHPLLRRGWNTLFPSTGRRNEGGPSRLEQRISFDYAFAYIFLVALHGFSALKVLVILGINYQIATKVPRKYVPHCTWAFNICTLFANEFGHGYRYRWLALHVSPPYVKHDGIKAWWQDSKLMELGQWMDGYGGLISRWDVLFNITILRLISFNLDYYWSIDKKGASSLEKQLDPSSLSERDRVTISAEPRDFSFRNYIAYTLYAPLYLAGPILTFNDYISQTKYRAASIEVSRTLRYAIRFLLSLLTMEIVLHFNYIGAISKAKPDWASYSAAQLSLLAFLNLHIIWLKLLLPWRLFRLWALIDGIDPPENMIRCVNNNYSTQMFWRSWHRSYNRWLIRYIYAPLGGASFRTWQSSAQSAVTYLLVFTFVALWHDIKLRLLIWGWLIVFFMMPEWTAIYLFPKKNWERHPTFYRNICAVGALGNILMMVSANLIGFAVGVDGMQAIGSGIVQEWSGVLFLLIAAAGFYVAVQVMFEVREAEKRKGTAVKC